MLFLIDRDKPEEFLQQRVHSREIRGIFFSKDGQSIYTHSLSNVLRRWNANSFEKLDEFQEIGGHLSLSPDGESILASYRGQITLLNAHTLTPSGKVLACRGTRAFAFSPAGQIVTLSEDKRLSMHNVEDDVDFEASRSPVRERTPDLDFDRLFIPRGGALLVSTSGADEDFSLEIWETCSGRLLSSAPLGSPTSARVAVAPNGRDVVVAKDGQVDLYSIQGLHEQTYLAQHIAGLRSFCFSPDGETLACLAEPNFDGGGRAALTLWDTSTGKTPSWVLIPWPEHDTEQPVLRFHPSGESVFVAWPQGELLHYDRQGNRLSTLAAPPLRAIAFDKSVSSLLWGIDEGNGLISWSPSKDSWLEHWTSITKKTYSGESDLSSLTVGRHWLAVGGQDGDVRLFATTKPKVAKTVLQGQGSPVLVCDLNSTETLLASGTQQGLVRIHSVPDGKLLGSLEAHSHRVEALDFSSDDRFLLSASRDRILRLWQKQGMKFEPFLTLKSPTGAVVHAEFTPDGKKLAVLLRGESAVRLWHLDRLCETLEAMNIPTNSPD